MAFMHFANSECFTVESFLPYNVNKINFITDWSMAQLYIELLAQPW